MQVYTGRIILALKVLVQKLDESGEMGISDECLLEYVWVKQEGEDNLPSSF